MSQGLTLAEFPPVSTKQWDEAVRKDLGGHVPAQKLFYRAEDAPPGRFPDAFGARKTNAWRIRQAVRDIASARAALDAGAEELRFVIGEQNIGEVLDGLPVDRCPMHFEAGARAAEVLGVLVQRPGVRGSIDYEPFTGFDRGAKLVAQSQTLTDFRAITIGAHRFSDAGYSIVQELGFALAEGVELLAQLTDRGLTAAQVASTLAFSFGVGSEYFPEIAKLRAARTLWACVLEGFQPGLASKVEVRIFARTSHWTKAIYDPYMNLLRSTTESMAAVIGGADALEVEPFDDTYREPSEFARRLARNTQIILKKEAWLDRVMDPAGGSYYVETLTDSVAREAWKLLQEIEGAGGFLNFRATGALEGEAAAGQHRASIIGTNRYPDLAERAHPRLEREDPMPRAASAFEQIRLRTERYADRTGHTPRLLLLEAGDAKTRKTRAAFAADYFGSAGFAIEIANAVAGDPDAIVLCCSDAEYGAMAAKVTDALRLAGKSTPVIKACDPEGGVDMLRALEAHLGMEG